jgi:precorrin-6B methylase 2
VSELLVRANELEIQVDSAGQTWIRHRGSRIGVGSHGLSLLAAFSKPRTVHEVIDELAVGGVRDFVDLTSTVARLREAGILVGEGDATFAAEPSGWDASPIHVHMLRDVARTTAFIRAIEATVTPDDVVLDIGTGTGVLAAAAARAGARKVYAVEASKIADLARAALAHNGLTDRVEVLRGWSTQLALPERATVLVTETIGAEPLSERIVDTVHDAWSRHLAPDARVIPRTVRVMATLARMPEELRDRHVFTSRNVRDFNTRYALDFEPFRRAQDESALKMLLPLDEARSLEPLAEPVAVATIDLTTKPALIFRREAAAEAIAAGCVDAVIVHFELDLGPGSTLDGHPHRVADAHSWEYMTWLPPHPPTVGRGDRLRIVYDYAAGDSRISLEPG